MANIAELTLRAPELRPVEFNRIEGPQPTTGCFHEWGKQHRQAGSISESKPVAIVELSDGSVVLAEIGSFRFTDR